MWENLFDAYKIQHGKCFYTGRTMQLSYSSKEYKICPPDQLSIDRVDSNKGYTCDNIVLCCYAINNMKGDVSMGKFLEYLKFLIQKPVKIKIKKLNQEAIIPFYSRIGDAAMDITAISHEYEENSSGNKLQVYGTGLAVEIPNGYVGLLFPRSSISKTNLSLSNAVGVIDSNYRGEIKFKFKIDSGRPTKESTYHVGDRIGQLMIVPIPNIELIESNELSDTNRGSNGFGSSGN